MTALLLFLILLVLIFGAAAVAGAIKSVFMFCIITGAIIIGLLIVGFGTAFIISEFKRKRRIKENRKRFNNSQNKFLNKLKI